MAMYSFVVHDEECPGCGRNTMDEEAVHFKVRGSPTWDLGSANPPYGEVTVDPVGAFDDDTPDLTLETDDVEVTCSRCGHELSFRVEPVED